MVFVWDFDGTDELKKSAKAEFWPPCTAFIVNQQVAASHVPSRAKPLNSKHRKIPYFGRLVSIFKKLKVNISLHAV